jgi:hypothetical protein
MFGKSRRWIGVVAGMLATIVVPGGAGAQIFTPTFQSPQVVPVDDRGIYLNGGPQDFSVEGIWRRSLGGYDLGIRGGVAGGDRAQLLVGADLRVPYSFPDAPVLVAFTGGAQGVLGGVGGGGFQAGASVGYAFAEGGLTAVPYIHPRLALVNWRRGDDLDLEILADFGVDLVIQQGLVFRFGFALGRPTAPWGMGFAWR